MNALVAQDMDYLVSQSSGRLNLILSGMTALMNDTDNKVEVLESQNWFQRMVKTVTGKNRLTKEELRHNHEKMNGYMAEAISELYKRNCIDEDIMMSLGIQLNELYADHIQLKKMLGAFVSKLNEKIDSVDNFHMLTTEIEQGVYSSFVPIVAICKVMSQFDNRILDDTRKLDILRRDLIAQNIINDESVTLPDYLISIADVPVDEIGQIYMELGTIKSNYMAGLILRMVENYHFLPDMARKMKDINWVIDFVISEENLDRSVSFSSTEIYEDFLQSKIEVKQEMLTTEDIRRDQEIQDTEQLFLTCRFDESFTKFMQLAETGNPRAMYFIGYLYDEGLGVTEDEEKAVLWWKKGYESGNPLCGLNYVYRESSMSDTEKSKLFNDIYQSTLSLAESGDLFAQYELSGMYRSGLGIGENAEQAFYWRQVSANNGLWSSMSGLAFFYEKGYGTEKSAEKAFTWYKACADQGHGWYKWYVGNLYEKGDGVETDISKAIKYYTDSAQTGNSQGQYELAICYANGRGVSQDLVKAFELYMKSAEQGHKYAQNNLAYCYKNGQGTSVDLVSAADWFEKSAEQGFSNAQYALGNCYKRGEGVEQDIHSAVKWFEKAAEQGHAYAEYELGVCYQRGRGVPLDYKKALEFYKKSAEQGFSSAQNNLAFMYENGEGTPIDHNKAIEWFEKAAAQGVKPAIAALQGMS